MKCALVLLSVVAFACAVPVTFGVGKTVTIDEDGTLTIQGENGKKIVISKAIGHPGPKDIEITVGGPFGPTKTIQIDGETNVKTVDVDPDYYYNYLFDEERSKRSSVAAKESKSAKQTKSSKDSKYSKDSKDSTSKDSEADLLLEVFQEYRGAVDAKSYNKLLSKIYSHVLAGELNPAVYDVLNSFDQYRLAEKYANQAPILNRGYPMMRTGYPYQYPSQQNWYGNDVAVPEVNARDYAGQLQQEQPAADPWATYWQSIWQKKMSANPWFGIKRPALVNQEVDAPVAY